jgi:hypothetical protein
MKKFIHPQTFKTHNFHIQCQIRMSLHHWIPLVKIYKHANMWSFWAQHVGESNGYFFICGIYFTLNPRNLYFHMNVELDAIFTIVILEKKDKCVGVFRPFWWRKFPLEGFSHSWKVEYAKLVLPRISLLTSCTNKPQSYTLCVVECHAIKNLKPIWIHVVIHMQFPCGNHKNGDLCISTCVCWVFMFLVTM